MAWGHAVCHARVGSHHWAAIVWWCRITSVIVNVKNLSAKSGSKPDSKASDRRRFTCDFSRSKSVAGRPSLALRTPTAFVQRKRSASRWIKAASILSIDARNARSSCGEVDVMRSYLSVPCFYVDLHGQREPSRRNATPIRFKAFIRPTAYVRSASSLSLNSAVAAS